jgi:hypothetical protein
MSTLRFFCSTISLLPLLATALSLPFDHSHDDIVFNDSMIIVREPLFAPAKLAYVPLDQFANSMRKKCWQIVGTYESKINRIPFDSFLSKDITLKANGRGNRSRVGSLGFQGVRERR